ncbi:MAG: lipoprotein-releasing system permease protein [Paraglaciecola sp.]|jgi:lipoprotein-releasing system permease protein
MFHPVSAFIGLRYAKASKGNHFIAFINYFSVVGIALGLMSLITVLAVMNGFESQLKQRVLGITPHIVVDTRGRDTDLIQKLASIEGVLASARYIEAEGVLQSALGLQGVLMQGVEPTSMSQHSIIAKNMLIGKLDTLLAGEYRVVIGRALSQKLKLRLGDKTRLLAAGASVFSPVGRIPSQRIFTVSGIYDVGSKLDEKVVLLNIEDAANLLRTKVRKISQTRLFLYDAFDYQSVLLAIQPLALPSDNWRSRQGPLFDAVKMEKNMMALMLLLIIAVAAFNIVSALVMVVTEKQGDIAILLTQGMSRIQVLSIFLFNGTYNGIKGTVFGVSAGVVLVSQINNIISLLGIPILLGPDGHSLPVELHWQQVLVLVLFSLILCFVSSLYPAYRAVKVDPARALQYE